MRCAVLDKQGNVLNIIVADPSVDKVEGMTLVHSDAAGVGDTFDGKVFTSPVPVEVVQDPTPLEQLTAALVKKGVLTTDDLASVAIAVPDMQPAQMKVGG